MANLSVRAAVWSLRRKVEQTVPQRHFGSSHPSGVVRAAAKPRVLLRPSRAVTSASAASILQVCPRVCALWQAFSAVCGRLWGAACAHLPAGEVYEQAVGSQPVLATIGMHTLPVVRVCGWSFLTRAREGCSEMCRFINVS